MYTFIIDPLLLPAHNMWMFMSGCKANGLQTLSPILVTFLFPVMYNNLVTLVMAYCSLVPETEGNIYSLESIRESILLLYSSWCIGLQMYHYVDANGSVGLPAVEVHRNIHVNVLCNKLMAGLL